MSCSNRYCGVLPILLGLVVLLLATPTASALTATTPSTGGDCMPAIAASCFQEVYKDLLCQVNETKTEACSGRDIADLCFTVDDALNCTSDIIDGDCSASDGKLTYDVWLRGLRSVQSHLCGNNASHMKALVQHMCWDPTKFLSCVEQETGVYQPSDMMKDVLDARMCSGILRATSKCTSHAMLPGCESTSTSSDMLQDVVSTFLLETPCRAVCWQHPDPQGQPDSGAILAIALLAVLATVLSGALAFVTYRTSCFKIPFGSW